MQVGCVRCGEPHGRQPGSVGVLRLERKTVSEYFGRLSRKVALNTARRFAFNPGAHYDLSHQTHFPLSEFGSAVSCVYGVTFSSHVSKCEEIGRASCRERG